MSLDTIFVKNTFQRCNSWNKRCLIGEYTVPSECVNYFGCTADEHDKLISEMDRGSVNR